MLREFNSEGFVIQYRVDSILENEETYIFLSESIREHTQRRAGKDNYHWRQWIR